MSRNKFTKGFLYSTGTLTGSDMHILCTSDSKRELSKALESYIAKYSPHQDVPIKAEEVFIGKELGETTIEDETEFYIQYPFDQVNLLVKGKPEPYSYFESYVFSRSLRINNVLVNQAGLELLIKEMLDTGKAQHGFSFNSSDGGINISYDL